MDYSSATTCKQYAKEQGANYDPQSGQILYGQSSNMKALGVNDGTCANLINPMLKRNGFKCGVGVAGGGCNAVDNTCQTSNAKEAGLFSFEGFSSDNSFMFDLLTIIIMVLVVMYVFDDTL